MLLSIYCNCWTRIIVKFSSLQDFDIPLLNYAILSQAGMRSRFDIFILLGVGCFDPEARDRKHIRHIIERPMNASSTMCV